MKAGEMQSEGLPETWPKVAIIILNWNGWRDTIECLESVEKLTYPNYEVILVDNGSVDDSVARITSWVMARAEQWGGAGDSPASAAQAALGPGATIVLKTNKLTLIRSDENRGFAGGCNLAIDYALETDWSTAFIFLLNNDARIEPECLTACVTAARQAGAGIAGAIIESDDGQLISAGSRFPLELFVGAQVRKIPPNAECWTVDRVEGAAMLVGRSVVEQRRRELGYVFDPRFFVYGEEVELCIWAWKRGYTVVTAASAVARHRLTASSGGRGNPLAYYYITRNRIFLAQRLLAGWIKVLFHLWYSPSRLARAGQRLAWGKADVATAILMGLLDGYRGVDGRWPRHPEGHQGPLSRSNGLLVS